MEIVETIVIRNTEMEEKESTANARGTKAVVTDHLSEFIWTLQATWQLVHSRLEMDQAFERPVCKKKKLWETVAEKVNARLKEEAREAPGAAVKAHECDLKWRNMLSTYRKNAERAKRLGDAAVHWEFFAAMRGVLGKEARGGRGARMGGTKAGGKRFTPILPSPAPATPSASCSPRTPRDVLQLYVELQERKLNMWAQQRALEERKIEAINNLANAIASLASKDEETSACTPADSASLAR